MNTRNEGAVRARGVLHPWQRRLYTILLVPLGLMAANSIYLVAFTKISSFFMAMLLMHLALGLLIAIPFLVFAFTHGARMLANIRNRNAKIAGITIVALALTCIGTGVYMALKGATLTHRPVYLAHAFAIPAALVAFILHRRAAVHKLHLRRLVQWGGAVAAFLLVMAGLHKMEKPPQRIVNREGDTQFFLSSAETFDQGLLDGKKLAANTYCQDCHPDSFKRWEKSAHRFSSFNNPFYRRAVELMAERVGREKTKWCAGCHDPVVLFTGQMGKATMASFSYDQFEAQQGLTCMACHSIAEVKDIRGNGGYVVEESKQYPFAFTDSKVLNAGVLRDVPQGRPPPAPERVPLDARPEPLRQLVRLGSLRQRGALVLRSAEGEGLPRLPPSPHAFGGVRQPGGNAPRPRLPGREHGAARDTGRQRHDRRHS
jgi:hypothetical protein